MSVGNGLDVFSGFHSPFVPLNVSLLLFCTPCHKLLFKLWWILNFLIWIEEWHCCLNWMDERKKKWNRRGVALLESDVFFCSLTYPPVHWFHLVESQMSLPAVNLLIHLSKHERFPFPFCLVALGSCLDDKTKYYLWIMWAWCFLPENYKMRNFNEKPKFWGICGKGKLMYSLCLYVPCIENGRWGSEQCMNIKSEQAVLIWRPPMLILQGGFLIARVSIEAKLFD